MTARPERPTGGPADPPAKHSPLVRNAVLRFVLGSLVALIILAVGTAIVGGRVAERQALREARYRAALLAQRVAAPLVDDALRRRDPAAMTRIDGVLRERIRDGSLRHIKLWAADGTVLWADEEQLVGRTYAMPDDVRELFGTQEASAEVSTLDRAENSLERDERELLEVYAGAHDADGRPVVFEAYLPLDDLHRDEIAIVSGVLVVGLGGLLLFQAAVLPIAVRLARRVERAQAERSKMMRHALDASELERRRIAQELHDGVIQDMAGICFALPTVERQLRDDDGGVEARRTIRSVTSLVHKDANALRSMLIDLLPPDLGGAGFAMALEDIAGDAQEHGVAVQVDVDPALDVPPAAATLAYRVVREGMRNVVKHAAASSAVVRVRQGASSLEVVVSDDGSGLDPTKRVEPGHLGLQLLGNTVADFGGKVELGPGTDGGTVLRATIPVNLIPA